MAETLDLKIVDAWKEALARWHSPSVPYVIAPETAEKVASLGELGRALQQEVAFMHYPDFQTYMNLEKIAETFPDDPVRGAQAVATHEVGHRYCPYDTVTSIVLKHTIRKELEGKKLPYNADYASNTILNLFTDMCINTRLARNGEDDIVWAYSQISNAPEKADSKLWKVYAKSMELAWKQPLLPETVELSEQESHAAQQIADIFSGNFFDKSKWKVNVRKYAQIIHSFLEEEQKDQGASMDNSAENIPSELDEKTQQELAKKLAEIGSNGLPTNPRGLQEFQEIMVGYGQGDKKKASIVFYDRLSDAYTVMFATKPFGRSRVNPFQPIKWTPSMPLDRLDVDYSVQAGGRIIPGVNTYSWNTREREAHGGVEEVVPDLDLYLDSSGSMPNPLEWISLPVLASFVVAKKAHRKGAYLRSTNFSGNTQCTTQEWTQNLPSIFENLVIYYGGGTDFPAGKLVEGERPRQVLIITDTFLGNETETADAVQKSRHKNKSNRVTIYAVHPVDRADYLRSAGAEVIPGTTTDIFKKVIGKADEVYAR